MGPRTACVGVSGSSSPSSLGSGFASPLPGCAGSLFLFAFFFFLLFFFLGAARRTHQQRVSWPFVGGAQQRKQRAALPEFGACVGSVAAVEDIASGGWAGELHRRRVAGAGKQLAADLMVVWTGSVWSRNAKSQLWATQVRTCCIVTAQQCCHVSAPQVPGTHAEFNQHQTRFGSTRVLLNTMLKVLFLSLVSVTVWAI